MHTVTMARAVALAQRSMAIILANQAPSGAYVASPRFPVYRFSWLRDGAFIADAMSRAGQVASAEAFFGWCARVLTTRATRIEDLIARAGRGEAIATKEFLHTRYTLDGDEATDDWWNFQLDGYGTWLWALAAHVRRHARAVAAVRGGAVLSARYVAAFWTRPTYDWWEEHASHRHTSTLAAIWAGLQGACDVLDLPEDVTAAVAAATNGIRDTVMADAAARGRLAKWLEGNAVDASLLAVAVPFGLLAPDHPHMRATLSAIEADLVHAGGVHRYLADTYYGGGEWPLLSGFLGWYYARLGRRDEARAELDWIVRHASGDGELPEQVEDHLLAPGARAAWLDRWGPVASPLLWSHAMYLTLAFELGVIAPTEPAR
jgi:GH15 family glucan-1,4-alpha-glucosidase